MYPIAEIRKKFKDKFPSVKEILGLESDGSTSMISIDKAPRKDIIAEYIDRLAKRGKLKSELKGIKDETETRSKAQALPASAKFPPTGRVG